MFLIVCMIPITARQTTDTTDLRLNVTEKDAIMGINIIIGNEMGSRKRDVQSIDRNHKKARAMARGLKNRENAQSEQRDLSE